VEFALVLPLFLILWFGVIEFGLAMYAKGLITNASQEGARFGAIYRLTPLSSGEVQAFVQGYLQEAGFSDPVTITVAGAGGPSGTPLSVRVDYAYHFLALPNFVAGLVGDITLSAETVVRLE
jgi:Flp pilus assembly protein TadG